MIVHSDAYRLGIMVSVAKIAAEKLQRGEDGSAVAELLLKAVTDDEAQEAAMQKTKNLPETAPSDETRK